MSEYPTGEDSEEKENETYAEGIRDLRTLWRASKRPKCWGTPSDARRDRTVIWQSLGASLALIAVSLFPVFTGGAGLVYSVGGVILSLIFVYYTARFAYQRSNLVARRLLFASIVYLPVIFILLMLDKK